MKKIQVKLSEMPATAAKLAKELGGKTISNKGLSIYGNPSISIVTMESTSAAFVALATVEGVR